MTDVVLSRPAGPAVAAGTTETLAADAPGLARAAALLQAGGLVAFPTETVYGLGADARNPAAVAGIFAAKGRPDNNPLIVHVADLAQAQALVDLPDLALRLAAAFWPGPLTLVLPLRPGAGLAAAVTAGLPSVGLRLPAHPVARALLAAFGGPVAAPSANPSGRISPTTAAHVHDGLGGRIVAVLDGGACAVGVESTILDLTGARPRLLRPGGVTVEELGRVMGREVSGRLPSLRAEDKARPLAPGQFASHYAPAAAVRLDAAFPEPGEVWLGFGQQPAGGLTLSVTGDLAEAAARLFDLLRRADALAGPGGRIAVARVPDHGLGLAINDRLRRAAAPRE